MHTESGAASVREVRRTTAPTACNDTASGVVTAESLMTVLAELGLSAGDTVLVHASLSSLGFVVGGPVAVVRALLDTLGPRGTVAVPTFTAGNSDPSRWATTGDRRVPPGLWPVVREHLPAFDVRITPSDNMGRVAETVRTWPGAVRSAHPQTSFAAVGARAAELVRAHPQDCHLGPGTPLERLVALRAKVLLLGVAYSVCSAFHLAEYLQPNPPTREYECVVTVDGHRRWRTYTDVDLHDDDFGQLGLAMEASAAGARVKRARLGSATVRLIPIEACVDFARSWIASNRPVRADRDGSQACSTAAFSTGRAAR